MAVTTFLFRVILILQIISLVPYSSCKKSIQLNKNDSTVSVLASVFPPFTYFDEKRGLFDGIEILASNIIANRLHLRPIYSTTKNTAEIQDKSLE